MRTPIKTYQPLLTITLGALALLALDAAVASTADAQGNARVAPPTELAGQVVHGEAARPGAFYVLERSRSVEPPGELRRTFVRQIVESVRDDAF